MAKQKLIGLTEESYTRLSLIKRGYSFNQYVEIMLNYFETTKIDPKTCQESPAVAYLKEVDRLVKIIKAQEKKYTDLLQNINRNMDYLTKIFNDAEKYNQTLSDSGQDYIDDNKNESIDSTNNTNNKANIETNKYSIENLKSIFITLDRLNKEKKVTDKYRNYYFWNINEKDSIIDVNNIIHSDKSIQNILMRDCKIISITHTEIKIKIIEVENIFLIIAPLFDKVIENLFTFYSDNVYENI